MYPLQELGYLKQLLVDLKGDIDTSTIIMGDFNINGQTDYTGNKQRHITANYTINRKDLGDICRAFHPASA